MAQADERPDADADDEIASIAPRDQASRRTLLRMGLACLSYTVIQSTPCNAFATDNATIMTTRTGHTKQAAKTASKKRPLDSERLPRHVRPSRYDLALEPDLIAGTFTGTTTIAVQIERATRTIVLNAADLTIERASIVDAAGVSRSLAIDVDVEHERLTLTAPTSLRTGAWTLRLTYRGTINDQLRGFYLSTYTDDAGMTQRMAVTQFEAADARRAFPCWDEPDFKAVFALTLTIDPDHTAVSNTQVLRETTEQGKKVVQFADTMVMSTYLVAFVVGLLTATEPAFVGRTPIRVWTRPGKTHLGQYALDWAVFSLRFLEEYYGIPYPGDKLDLIGIPDFSYGAMENLGAVTFREAALLTDPATATHGDRQNLADVVSHENAHMWFGDLVTMAWWNGLWLNEAFATFLEVVVVDAWKPEWRRWDQFGSARAGALSTDGLFSSRAIEFPVRAVKDLGAMFDVLTYQKGAAVLRMLEQFLGASVFREGIRRYLRAHAYANAETDDLWQALADTSHQPVGEIMHNWVFTPGYPLVTVSRSTARNGATQLVLKQQRFTYLDRPALARRGAPSTVRWKIPLLVATQQGDQPRTESPLLMTEATHRVPLSSDTTGVLVNPGGHGYYRVRYAPELRAPLVAQYPNGLEPIDRFNFVNDEWALCMAGLSSLTDYLDVVTVAARDRSPHVWSILLASFDKLETIVADADRPTYEAFIRSRLTPLFAELGWTARPDDSDLVRELRGDVIETLAVQGNDPAVQTEALRLYTQAVDNPTAVDPNLIPALIAIAAWTGDAARYEEFISRRTSAATPQTERRFLFGLAGFRSPELVTRTLTSTISGEVRTQDAAGLVGSLLSSRHGHDAAWRFLVEHWEMVHERWPSNGLRRLFSHLAARADSSRERAVARFVKDQRIDLGGKALAQSLEQIRIAVAFRERNQSTIRQALQRNTNEATGR
ncbi:MAG: M1 family aminopeptidase [Nitrospiraceae bacterium]